MNSIHNTRHIRNLVILSMIIIFGSCKKYKCIEGDGHYVIENRSLANFDEVVSNDDYTVYIYYDSLFSVTVDADQNLLPYIGTVIRDGVLYLEKNTDRCVRAKRKPEIRIGMPELFFAELSGTGMMQIDGFKNDRMSIFLSGDGEIYGYSNETYYLNAQLSGSGLIELEGFTEQSDILLEGSGTIRTYHLEQRQTHVNIKGTGDVIIFAWDLLDAVITGSGTVYYRAPRPLRVTYNIPGTGAITPL